MSQPRLCSSGEHPMVFPNVGLRNVKRKRPTEFCRACLKAYNAERQKKRTIGCGDPMRRPGGFKL